MICPEALRMGWPSALPSNWCCTRSIFASTHLPSPDSPNGNPA
jgi:hypothetical protein